MVKEPIYQQLNQVLRKLIRSGKFPVGSKFLTEREISARYDVSRATSNKSLSSLVSEGLLDFRKGVGTFVRDRKMDYNLRGLVSFTAEAEANGKSASSEVLQFERLRAHDVLDEVPSLLKANDDDELVYVERIRKVDEAPVILERRYIVSKHCPELSEADAEGSIYTAWVRKYGLRVEGADQSIRVVNVRGLDAKLLEVPHGTAGFLVVSTGLLAGGEPLWFERTLYRGDSYEFHNRLGAVEEAGPPMGRFLSGFGLAEDRESA
jgi:GntR family transcriptional regulator